jgi:hypothetical protein
MAAHDLADLLEVRRAAAGEHSGDLLEVGRAHQPWTDDGEEAGIDAAIVAEPVDHAAGDEQRLTGVQVGALTSDGEGCDSVETEDGLVEAVVAVLAPACARSRIAWSFSDNPPRCRPIAGA